MEQLPQISLMEPPGKGSRLMACLLLRRIYGLTRIGWLPAVLLFLLLPSNHLAADSGRRAAVIVTSLGGTPEYEENFEHWGDAIEEIFASQPVGPVYRIDGRQQRRTDILEVFEEIKSSLTSGGELWIFLIGHATYDGHNYKFNVAGPTVTDSDLKAILDDFPQQKVFLVAATNNSGVLEAIAGPGRVVVAATRSRERIPPLFMSFFVEGAGSTEADINKDGTISLEEIFGFSEQKVAAWYEEKGRLRTEHPQLFDQPGSDALASMAFLSVPPEEGDYAPEAKELVQKRVELQREVEDLKRRKGEMAEVEYYGKLEQLLIGLANLNRQIDESEGGQ